MMKYDQKRFSKRQQGLTLIEFMVSMALAIFVIAIAGTVLTTAGFGYKTTSANAQLNDASMSVAHSLKRGLAQAGYQPAGVNEIFTREFYYSRFGENPRPDIYGRSNQTGVVASTAIDAANIQSFYTGAGTGGLATSTNAASDLVAIRFQAVPESKPDSLTPEQTSTLDLCTGQPLVVTAMLNYNDADREEMHKPIFMFFAQDNKLYCVSWVPGAGANVKTNATAIMSNVLAFRLLYGVAQKGGGSAKQAPTVWKKASDMSAD
ncbi:MAG: PilW family protein, partial [Saezia sp.]